MPTVVACPNCGYRFSRPFFSQRRFGVGVTFAVVGMGVLTCPKCKFNAGTRSFKKVTGPPSPEPQAGGENQAKGESTAEGETESKSDSVDDSKYV